MSLIVSFIDLSVDLIEFKQHNTIHIQDKLI